MEKSVALVLSSGGARGLAHIGVIEELEKQGFRITSVSGSSIGSWIGGMHAMGQLDHFSKWVCALNRLEILNLMDITLSTHGVLKVEKAFKKLEKEIPDVLIEDLSIPYVAMATDIVNKKEVAFTSGSLYKAIRASIAIPAIITSVQENNKILVDGGVLNPLPIKQVHRTPGDILVAVNLYGPEDNEKRTEEIFIENTIYRLQQDKSEKAALISWNKLLELLGGNHKQNRNYISIFETMIELVLQSNVNEAITTGKPDIMIHIPKSSAKAFDFHKAEELIEIGRMEALKSITDYRNNCITD